MDQNDSNPQSNPQHPQLENFKGKIHSFSKEDSIKGGSQSSPRKIRANGTKFFKTGNYSKRVPHCNTCIFRDKCSAYDPKEPKAACKVINIPNYFHLMSALTFNSEEEFDNFISKHVQRMYLKNLTSDDWKKLLDFLTILLKVKETKYRTPKEQTINIQVNNFQVEFQQFKDATLKVLKKHPDVLLEWREELGTARRTN